MTDQTTPEPLTDDELAAMRDRSQGIDCAREAYDSAEDVPRLLDEVDRLRTERDRLYTETLRLGISLAETIHERHQARQALGATQRDRAAALDVAADLTAERDQARAEIDRQRHEREKYTERWDALDLQRLAALELHALPFCETCNDHGPCETRRALDGDGVTACTGCETCSVCRARGLHRWEAIATVRPGHVETTPGSTPLTLAQAAGHLHDWARDLADGTRTDWPAGHPDIIHGIRAAADWLDARATYETEVREQLRALVDRHGMADRTCLIGDDTTE